MSDVEIRIEGRAGRITLNRPSALNALTWEMCGAIERALDAWAEDDAVALVVIDGAGERAFCSGGDISEMYRTGRAGDYGYGRRFWADEYQMNRKLHHYAKPVAAFLHGFTMGGGVGIGCHASHRVVSEDTKIAMPECGIGLIPDVGGSLLLARAPGRLGEYLGTTGQRIGPGDAIHSGFADRYVPRDRWHELIAALERTGDPGGIEGAAQPAPPGELASRQNEIDTHFARETLGDILAALAASDTAFAADALQALGRNAPLSMACTLEVIRRVRAAGTIEAALDHEYRFTYRAIERGDFLEGIRAAIIDKDRQPKWRHADPADVPRMELEAMLTPLGEDRLKWEGT